MLRLSAYSIAILLAFISVLRAQVDPSICPGGPTSDFIDPRWRPVPPRFEVVTELISGNDVSELSQAFSTSRDSIAFQSFGGNLQAYYNFQTNELFDVLTVPKPFCLRQPITATTQTSVIVKNTLFVKPSILLGYNERNQVRPRWGLQYVSDDELRAIPTNVFRSCFFVDDIQATVSVTYQVSDPLKFQPYPTANQSIILQMNVTVKNSQKMEQFTYNIFRYVPNPSRREERQALETPTGMFCPNRTSTMPVPSNIPERVSSNAETFIPMGNASSIFSSHNLYDTEFQFTRFDLWFPDGAGRMPPVHFTEIHDYAVGLSYRYDNGKHQCVVSNIDGNLNDAVPDPDNPTLIQMGNPQHVFLMDDVEYQYTGEKPCRDRVWCHVWIAEKNLPNNTVQHREWYWSSSVNGKPVVRSSPVKLILKQYMNGTFLSNFELNVFNYRRRPMTIFEIDSTLAECYRALGPAENYNLAVLSFRIINDKQYPLFQNLNYLRLHIWETLMFTMRIRPTRISNLLVDQDDSSNDIIVTFTVLDAPPRTGNVPDPLREATLDRVIERLSNFIDSDDLSFRGRYDNRQVTLRARSGSLNVPHRSTKTVKKTSGPQITGLWIGFIIVGLVVGAAGGYFALGKFSK